VPSRNAGASRRGGFFSRHRHVRNAVIGVLAVVLVVAGALVYSNVKTTRQQNALQPFYDTTGLPAVGPLGQVVRSQRLGITVAHGVGLRIL